MQSIVLDFYFLLRSFRMRPRGCFRQKNFSSRQLNHQMLEQLFLRQKIYRLMTTLELHRHPFFNSKKSEFVLKFQSDFAKQYEFQKLNIFIPAVCVECLKENQIQFQSPLLTRFSENCLPIENENQYKIFKLFENIEET